MATAYVTKAICRSAATLGCFFVGLSACSGQLPSDVRSNHWAAGAVAQVLKSGVMSVENDHQFHGEGHVTHLQAVIALATLARKLDAGTWPLGATTPVPDKVTKTLEHKTWQTLPVTRYQMASALARIANYFTKAIARPKPGIADLGKSDVLPNNVKIPVPASSPAYSAYKFLTDGKMISAESPLLKADSQQLKASELSRGIAEMAAGVNNRLTELGHDETGSTPDKSFHPKK